MSAVCTRRVNGVNGVNGGQKSQEITGFHLVHAVHLVHVIEVPRSLPLKAILTTETERANKMLNDAMHIASKVGSEAVAEVVQAREAGSAIVEEARDHHCSLLLIGLVRDTKRSHAEMGKTVSYVLANAPCRVWLVQDPAPTTTLA